MKNIFKSLKRKGNIVTYLIANEIFFFIYSLNGIKSPWHLYSTLKIWETILFLNANIYNRTLEMTSFTII